MLQVGLVQSGCGGPRTSKSPSGTRTKALGANRVQSPSGSFNARWRREPGCDDTDRPEADRLRVSTETVEREKLNDERGVKPLPVRLQRDGAKSGKEGQAGKREASVFYPPK